MSINTTHTDESNYQQELAAIDTERVQMGQAKTAFTIQLNDLNKRLEEAEARLAERVPALNWSVSRHVDGPSKLVWSVMVGITEDSYMDQRPPNCTFAFAHTYHLLKTFPQWRERLPEVAAKYPWWMPYVRDYDDLVSLYEAWEQREDKNSLREWHLSEAKFYELSSESRS